MRMTPWMRGALALVVLGSTASAVARDPPGLIGQTEASMLVQGEVDIDTAGRLERLVIKDRDTLPASVVAVLEGVARGWAFKPRVRDGQPVDVHAPFVVRVVASKIDHDRARLRIAGAMFGSDDRRPDDVVKTVKLVQPRFPPDIAKAGNGGDVYLLLRVGRDGKVEDLAVEQVDLEAASSASEMARLRRLLARAALAAARQWQFRPPTSGESVQDDAWYVRGWMQFSAGPYVDPDADGIWRAYLPGPTTRASWTPREADLDRAGSLMGAKLLQIGSGPRLLTPLDPG